MSQKYYTDIVVPTHEAAMLDGRMFRWFTDFTLGTSSTKEFLIQVPSDKQLVFHGRDFSAIGARARLDVYAGPTVDSNGASNTNYFNLNGTSSITPDVELWEDPTISADGSLVDVDTTFGTTQGSGNKGSTGSATTREFPRIMTPGVLLLARVTNISTTDSINVLYKLFWEEVPQ